MAWERRMAPLMEIVEPVTPPVDIWHKIEQRIDPQIPPASSRGLWNSLNFWRGLGMATTLLVVVLGLSLVGLQRQSGELRRVIVVLNEQSQAGWLVGTQDNREMLRVSAVQPTRLPADKVCQLWLVTDDGGMLPLGVLPHAGSMEMRVPTLLRQDSRFKVSIESAASAPVERPSQEIVFEGKQTSI
jgi:anti-sigma-K factor RskA